jgi:hypothetical protein
MRKSVFIVGYLLWGIAMCASRLAAQAVTEDDPVPVAPVAPTNFEGWTNAFRLSTEDLSLVLVPEIGRIAHLGWADEPNLLRLDARLLGLTADEEESDDWVNFGGDWIWPVAQTHWPLFQQGDWPPSRLLDGREWTGRAWRTEDGTLHSLITKDFGAPLHVRVHRTARLSRNGAMVVIRQRLERLAPSAIPVTIWQLSQMADVDYVFMPYEEDSVFEGGLVPLLFDMPGTNALHRCAGVAVYRASEPGEHKVGSDSPQAWVAALKGDTLLIQRVEAGDGEGTYPDGGCTVEFFANRDLGYVEIESLSIETLLEPGAYIDNTLYISLHRLPEIPADLCDLADLVRSFLPQ